MSLKISQQASSSDAESIPQPTPPLTAAVSIKLPPYTGQTILLFGFLKSKHSLPHVESRQKQQNTHMSLALFKLRSPKKYEIS